MSIWIAVKQALMVLDAVERTWGREVGLDGSQVMIFLLLSRMPGRSASDLALSSGRQRQNVWRSLGGLKKRGLVHAVRASERGTEGWSLSPDGVRLARALELRLAAWEGLMGQYVNLEEVSDALQHLVKTVVNRPSAKGWRRGLLQPEESWKDPEWNAHLELAALTPGARKVRTAEDYARIDAVWNKIWNS